MEKFEHTIRFTADGDNSMLKFVIENLIVNKSTGTKNGICPIIERYNENKDEAYQIILNDVGQVDFLILVTPNCREHVMFCGIGENDNTEENPEGWYIWQKEHFGMPYNALNDDAYIKYINDKCVEVTFYTMADLKGKVSWGDILDWMPTKWYDALANLCFSQNVHFEGNIRSTNYQNGKETIVYKDVCVFNGKVITIGNEAVFYDRFEANWD